MPEPLETTAFVYIIKTFSNSFTSVISILSNFFSIEKFYIDVYIQEF